MHHEATACGCTKDIGKSKAHIPQCCTHGNLFLYTKALGRNTSSGSQRPQRTPLKRRRGMAASRAQQAKVRDLPCIHCGRDRHEGVEIQAAHVYPRRFASCSCAGGVVPLCGEGHTLYDEGKLDLLPLLLTNGYRAELVHAIVEHEASPMHVIEVVTGCVWAPLATDNDETAAGRLERSAA